MTRLLLVVAVSISLAAVASAAPVPAARVIPPEPDPKPTPGGHIFDVAYSPDRKTMVVLDGPISFDKTKQTERRLTLYDAATHEVRRRVADPGTPHSAYRSVRFFPDGKLIYLWCIDGFVHTCDPATGEVRNQLDIAGQMLQFSLAPDGKTFVVGRRERVKPFRDGYAVWDATTFRKLRDLTPGVELEVMGAYAPDGKAVAFEYKTEGEIGVIELNPLTGAEIRRAKFNARTPGAQAIAWPAAYSPGGQGLILAGGEAVPTGKPNVTRLRGYLRVWDRQTGAVREVGDGPRDYYRAVALSADGKRLYAGTLSDTEISEGRGRWSAGKVQCWDTATWREVWSVETRGGEPQVLTVAPSGRRLWVADRFWLHLLDADTGESRGRLIETPGDGI